MLRLAFGMSTCRATAATHGGDQQAISFRWRGGKSELARFVRRDRQLILYHFMFALSVGGWPDAGCDACSWYADNVGNLSHLHARDTSFAMISLAPFPNILAYKKRMGWTLPWFSSAESDFNMDFGMSTPEGEISGTSVFLRDQGRVFRTYFTMGVATKC
jgi:predicted dithiol-disulfide oxidoreductase (DUF899 family)